MDMETEMNRRQFGRSKVRARAEVRLHNGIYMEGETRNVSLKGALLDSERFLPVGNPCRITLTVQNGPAQGRIEISGFVVRADRTGMGIEFTHIDTHSLKQLRHLVLYAEEEIEQRAEEYLLA
jgi:hypothetical protein